MNYEYDMIVIGGGSAGLTAAGMAALLGAKTALIEQHRLGGDCTWVGCIPSKTLLKAARVAQEMRTADRFGLSPVIPEVPFSRLMEHVRRIRQQVYEGSDAPRHMEKLGVEVISAAARFQDPHTIELSNTGNPARLLTARFFVIATGSRPLAPEFSSPCLTNENIFELTSQPKRLLVMGAGPVGIEMAQAFRRLGSVVTVVAPGNLILHRDDPEHAKILLECLSREGIVFILGRKVTALEREQDGFQALLDDGRTVECDAMLAAIGRKPNIATLDLPKAGVDFGKKGVPVDRHCRTSQRHIFAAGDVTGRHQFTHMAEHMSKVAVTNAILRWPKTLDEKHVVWATFTEPELAHLGESEAAIAKRNPRCSVYRFPFRKLDRAITDNEVAGEVKIIADKSGRLLAVSIVGANAGEMISEFAIAMRNGLRLSRISETIHPYPTYLLGNRQAADQEAWKQLDSPLLTVLGKFLCYRGVRKGSAALR
jgi:pyruvate/2-oxoglutarate dehydrogenase complex dihydrolipoamide dehydrogenase (E3) component